MSTVVCSGTAHRAEDLARPRAVAKARRDAMMPFLYVCRFQRERSGRSVLGGVTNPVINISHEFIYWAP